MAIRSYEDLTVWQTSMDLVVEVYALCRLLPREEQFGLATQLRRAAVSIPSNIAEGHGRLHKADFIRCLSIARGSLMEVRTQLHISERLEYLTPERLIKSRELSNSAGKQLNNLIKALDRTSNTAQGNNRIFEDTEQYNADY